MILDARRFLYSEHCDLSPGLYPLVFGINVMAMAVFSRLNIRLLAGRAGHA
ncbi:MAG: hypothetical protein IBX53_03430 [Halomonas sp.]|uniref:hypothetical protein n=1 Tax=Halomonas sp. TaxID=1486246 RepID=UPI0019FCF05B|nr:hypothetical protein [Halomonas sp.]MBE0488108.1 hypothetical protein [Halomonas sp.]